MKRLKYPLIKPVVGEREIMAIRHVFESGWLTEGQATRKFEEMVAEYVGAKYAVAFPNCTLALETCLRILGIGKRDKVLVPDFTHPATALAVMNVGAVPVLMDVNLKSYNVILRELELYLPFYKIAIPVSWGGNPLNPVEKRLDDSQIIEDAACSLGATYGQHKTGSAADLTCFSFHPRKIITTGEGGMVTTNDWEFAQDLKVIKSFGADRGVFAYRGSNYKLSDVQAAMGIAQMHIIDQIIEKRVVLAMNYDELFEDFIWVNTPEVEDNVKHVFQTYAIYLKKDDVRDHIIRRLKEKGIETQIGTYALHLQPLFASAKRLTCLINSTKLFRNLLALPMYDDMTYADQEYVVKEIKELLK